MIIKSLALALVLAPAAIGAASADETFYFTFNDSAFNDVGVTETGWVTIADTGLGVGAIRQDTIVNGSVTVSGTVYGPEDWVGGFIDDWSLFPLNLTTQLVGQNVIVVCTFGDIICGSTTGDFNLFPSAFGNVLGAPIAFAPFTQEINGDKLGLVSLTVSPTVPEPSSWALMLVGFAGLGLAGFHRARRTALPDVSDRVRR